MNKFSKLLSVLFVASLCLGFSSCSDDDNEDYAKKIKGTYVGAIAIDDIPVADGAEIIITYVSENKVSLKMNQEILGLAIDIECESAVSYSNNRYNIYALVPDFEVEMEVEVAPGVSMPVSVPAPVLIDGYIDKNGKANLGISVAISGAPISVVYEGQKQ